MLVLNVLFCFWFNNVVLDGDFYWLGFKWVGAPYGNEIKFSDIESDGMNRAELLYKTFPRRAECTVSYVGSGGGIQKMNYYCILAPNVLSQYVFLILWFWYSALLIINSLNLVRNMIMILKIGVVRNVYLMKVVGSTKVTLHT